MLDKDKIILTMYVNIGSIDSADIPAYMEQLTNTVIFDDSILRLFIPVRNSETRVECINPKRISDEEYIKVSEFVEDAQKKLNEFLNSFNNGTK